MSAMMDSIFATLEELAGDDSAFVEELLGTYVSQAADLIEAIERGRHAHDCEAVRRAAHALAGSSMNIGAAQTALLCRAIERAAEEGTDIHDELMTALVADIDHVRCALLTAA